MSGSYIGSGVRPISEGKDPDKGRGSGDSQESYRPFEHNQSCFFTPTRLGFQMPAIFLLAQEGLMAAVIITQIQGPALVPLSQKRPRLLSMQLTSQSRCVFTLSTPHSFPRYALPCHSLAHHILHIHVHLSRHMCFTDPPPPYASQTVAITL